MNNFMKEIDDFTVCLGEYGNDEESVLFWLQVLIERAKEKIFIINFSGESIKKYINEIEEKWDKNNFVKSYEFKKIVEIEENLPCSMKSVYEYMNSVSKEDYIFIVGGERLLSYSNKDENKLITTYKKLKLRTNFMENEDWNTYCLWVDKLYGEFLFKVKGIILNIGIDCNTKSVILSLLEKSNNMSIICTEKLDYDTKSNEVQNEFYTKLIKCECKYDDMIKFLNENRNFVSEKNYIIMLSNLYMFFGVNNKAVELLMNNYEILDIENKKLLADLLYRDGKEINKCKDILLEVFDSNKFLKNLMPSILRVYENDNDEVRKKWIDKSLKIDPDNPLVIEHYGNWLSHIKNYEKAAEVFRSLKLRLDNQYYEIVARINDILNNPPDDKSIIIDYVLQAVQDYPELHNDAILRLVIYFDDIDISEYITYSLLNDINYSFNDRTLYELLNKKLDMLNDVIIASKALGKLKPYNKEKHAEKINIERIKCITNSIITLAKYEGGNLQWRNFIDNCQSYDGWFNIVIDELVESINILSGLDIENLITKSFIYKLEYYDRYKKLGIKLLREYRAGNFDTVTFEDIEDIKKAIIGLLKYAELENDEELKIWGRYYASIIYSFIGDEQLGNNYALSILSYYNIINNRLKNRCILLGLMSWSNSQFRIGRDIEGIICIISCIKYINELEEIYPLLEEGLNLVGRFLSENVNKIKYIHKQKMKKSLEKLSKYNDTLKLSYNFMYNIDKCEHELKEKINSTNKHNIEWAGNITNLINLYINNNKDDEAINLIRSNYKKIMELNQARKDIRFKLSQNWAKTLYLRIRPCEENYLIAKELLEVAIKDIEDKSNIYHKEERAGIGDMSRSIYIMYIEIIILINKIFKDKIITDEEMYKIIESNLINICYKSIIEQKIYNQDNCIDKDLEQKEITLKKLREEYDILYSKNAGESNELNNIAIKIQSLQEDLKQSHPYYRPLPNLEKIRFEEIKKSLKDKEVFYQYIRLNIISLEILVSDKDVIINNKLLDVEEIDESLKILNEHIYGNKLSGEENNIIKSIDILSKQFSSTIIDYCQNNELERVYIMPDLSLGAYNICMSMYKEVNITDNIKSIINILDYNVLKSKNNLYSAKKFVNKVFGNKDKNLQLIDDFIKKYESEEFKVIDDNEDEIEILKNTVKNEQIDTILIYGHGLDDPNGSKMNGSLGIQGKKHLIHIQDIIKNINTIKNIILISCKGGIPLNRGIESSTGNWAELFERFRGNIITCKWDVSTEPSIYIVENILTYLKQDISLDKSLLLAINDAKNKYKNPIYWAGIEFWLN